MRGKKYDPNLVVQETEVNAYDCELWGYLPEELKINKRGCF